MANSSDPLPRKTSDDNTALLQHLEAQYKERWPVLVGKTGSSEHPRRLALRSAFIACKAQGEQVLSHGAVSLYGPAHAANKEPSRHISSGLLTQFWCFPSSVLPAMTCNVAEKVLVLGQPLPGRLLALIQLLFAPANCTDAGSHRGPLAVSADGTNIPEAAVAVSITGTETKASRSDRSEEGPGWQPGLSWNVYGEGPEPRGWGSRREAADGSRLPQKPSEGQQGAAPASWQQQQWTSVGTFVEGLLHRSIRAGCCTVRTSSGDWAELSEQAMQEQLAAQAALQSQETGEPPCSTTSQPPNSGTSASAPTKAGSRSGSLDILQPRPEVTTQLQMLLENHVPSDVRTHIRFVSPAFSEGDRWHGCNAGSYSTVIVEAPCSASREAFTAAYHYGRKTPWPLKADRELIAAQLQMLLTGFDALMPGGCLLFCSNSLAWEETDGVVEHGMAALGDKATVLAAPRSRSGDTAADQLHSALKQFEFDRTQLGWRMIPDLAVQSPQYFSLILKAA